jgi:peptidoglycan/LPS O-acetylase OafA/YrhL
MRTIAIAFVVVSHGMWIFPESNHTLVRVLRSLGYLGVEIFFVLSGFLIGRLLYRRYTARDFGRNSFMYFLVRRWFRTLPNYYLILLLNIPIWLFFGRELPDKTASYFVFAQNLFGGMPLFFTESWSLPIEEFAYIVLPLTLMGFYMTGKKGDRNRLFLYAIVGLLLFFLCTKVFYHFALFDPGTYVWNIDLKAVTVYRIDAIVYGVLAAFLSINYQRSWKQYRVELLFAGLFIFGVSHLLWLGNYFESSFINLYRNILYLPLVSISIGCSLPFLSSLTSVHNVVGRPVRFVSLVSYSVYLLHYSIVLQFMRYHFPVEGLAVTEKVIYILLYISITLFLSFLLYRFYERPVMDLRDRAAVKELFSIGKF